MGKVRGRYNEIHDRLIKEAEDDEDLHCTEWCGAGFFFVFGQIGHLKKDLYGDICNTLKGKYQEWLTEEGLLQLEAWARDGLTEEQIAHNMGINRRTLTDWKNKYTPISLTLKRGKDVVDIQVENVKVNKG